MARQLTRHVDSTDIQGEGTWVEFKRMTYGESKRFAALQGVNGMVLEEQFSLIDSILQSHIAGWNWTDEHGKPLPCPSDDAAVIDNLTNEEMTWLTEQLVGGSSNAKK